MKLTPFSIKNQQFNKSLRGYDPQEVSVFLEGISDEVERLNSENENLKKELEKTQAKIIEYKKIEKSLQDTLLKANESTSRSAEAAQKKADSIINEAQVKANQILNDARIESEKLREAVENLREEKNVLIAKIKAIVNSQAGLVEMKLESIDKQEERSTQAKPQEIKTPENLNINLDEIIEKLL